MSNPATMSMSAAAVSATEDGLDAVAGVRGLVRGQLAIGVIQTVGPVDIPALLARYHRRHPAVTLRLHHADVSSLVHQTADGELELAVVDLPLGPQAGRVTSHPIGTESLQLGVAEHDPLASRHRVRLIDLADRDFVEYRPDSSLRARIDQACQAAGLQRRVACEVDTIADLVELVVHGLGVSLLPPAAIRTASGRVIGLATDPPIPRDLMLVTPLEREPSPAASAFLELLKPELPNNT